MCLERNVALRIIPYINMIQSSISNCVHPSRSTRMYSCSSILRLCSFVLLLAYLLNLVDVCTVDIVAVYYLIGILKSELAISTFFLTLWEIDNVIDALWSGAGVTVVVFERYLVLSDVDSSTTCVRLSSGSLTVQLLFIVKACIC